MAIFFAGGRVTNRRNPADAALVVSNIDARMAVWRDFREGITTAEQAFFTCNTLPDGRGQLALTAAGRTALGRTRSVHEHVRLLLRATNSGRQFTVMPIPVFQQMPANLQWITDIATRRNPTRASMRITINTYGEFPVEWLGFEVAGRTHQARRRSTRDACVYATILVGRGLDRRVVASFNSRGNRATRVGTYRGDTPIRWVEREDTVTLFHELIHHAIVGRDNHAGDFDDWVERRARVNWRRHHTPA